MLMVRHWQVFLECHVLFPLQVRASDKGEPKPRRSMVKVRVQVLKRPNKSTNSPRFTKPYYEKRVMENDKVGHLIDLFQATDIDRDILFYSVIGNNVCNYIIITIYNICIHNL